jgi:hypothetical protein
MHLEYATRFGRKIMSSCFCVIAIGAIMPLELSAPVNG